MVESVFSFSTRTNEAAGRSGTLGETLRSVSPQDAVSWVWLAYDQLNVAFLESLNQSDLGVVLIESSAKARRRPYHQQKLGVLLANQRHFAVELQAQGVPVLYLLSDADYGAVLNEVAGTCGPVHCFHHAERELRKEVEQLVVSGVLVEHAHPGWLTPQSWSMGNLSVGSTASMPKIGFLGKVTRLLRHPRFTKPMRLTVKWKPWWVGCTLTIRGRLT